MAGTIGLAGACAPAFAEGFKFGEMDVSIDTTVSLGVGIRTSKQSCTKISAENGGCALNPSAPTAPTDLRVYNDVNLDDGNVNFGQWDAYSERVKFVTDAQAKWQNYGAFVRVKGFYDYIGDQVAGQSSTDYGKRPLSDSVRGNDAHNAAAWDLSVLDAFVYGNFNVANDLPLNLRLGKQVVNWGESLFIPGGINQFMSVDLGALRTPGAEIKEALLPQEMLYASLGLPNDMSLEAWAGFKWRQTQLDPVGTYFGNDIFGPGGAYLNIVMDGPANAYYQLPVQPSKKPGDFGQFGLKLGYNADWLNDGTELGLYYVNYDSNLPFLEYSNGLPGVLSGSDATAQYYRAHYVENIQVIGASFSTVLADFLYGTAFSGELVYQPNLPFQLSSGEMLLGHWGTYTGGAINYQSTLPYDMTSGAFPDGFIRTDSVTGQLGTVSTLPTSDWVTSHLDADLVILVANWGFQWLPGVSDVKLNALAASMSEFVTPALATRNPYFQLYHPDRFSHGYRLSASVQYNNAFGTAFTLTPNIQFAQDFGTSAGPIGPGFLDNKKTLSLGVRGTYQSAWSAGVQWTATRGNAVQNAFEDRDFMTFDVSYAF